MQKSLIRATQCGFEKAKGDRMAVRRELSAPLMTELHARPMLAEADLPDDPALLRAMLVERHARTVASEDGDEFVVLIPRRRYPGHLCQRPAQHTRSTLPHSIQTLPSRYFQPRPPSASADVAAFQCELTQLPRGEQLDARRLIFNPGSVSLQGYDDRPHPRLSTP